MKKLILILLILSTHALAEGFHLPETRNYIPRIDTGYTQYNTPSLHNRSQYVLTFDDGPHITRTPKLLDILKKHNVKATFFILTERLNNSTLPILKRILDEGHIAATHGNVHDHSNKLTKTQFKENLKSSFLKLKKYYELAGHKMKNFYYRFPYAEYGGNKSYHHMNVIQEVSQELFGENCIHFVFWDIDSGDWIPNLTPKEVADNIKAHHIGGEYTTYRLGRDAQGRQLIIKKKATVENPTRGGLILQHDIQDRTLEGADLFLEFAKTEQIQILPLTEVDEFSYKGLSCSFL